MPINGAAMAVFMEMTAETQWEGKNRRAESTPSGSHSGGKNQVITRVLNVRRDPLENQLRVCLFCPHISHWNTSWFIHQTDVWTLLHVLLNFPEPLQVPSPEQLDCFKRTKDERDGPTIDNLQLDLGGTGVLSFWNKYASRLFAAKFISQEDYACNDEDIIADAFMVHLRTLQSLYRKQQEGDVDKATEIMKYDKQREKARESRRRYVCSYFHITISHSYGPVHPVPALQAP